MSLKQPATYIFKAFMRISLEILGWILLDWGSEVLLERRRHCPCQRLSVRLKIGLTFGLYFPLIMNIVFW